MKIKYLGHSCFFLQGEDGVSVITDPYTKVGYELPQGLKSDILLISHGHFDHCYSQAVAYRSIVSEAGEKKCFGVKISGIDSFHDPLNGKLRGKNVIFKFVLDGLKVAILVSSATKNYAKRSGKWTYCCCRLAARTRSTPSRRSHTCKNLRRK